MFVKQTTNEKSPHYSWILSHANSALVMHLDQIPSQEIEGLNIPTAIPFYHEIDMTTGQIFISTTSPTIRLESVAFGGFTHRMNARSGVFSKDDARQTILGYGHYIMTLKWQGLC
jgi:hypothetical protein